MNVQIGSYLWSQDEECVLLIVRALLVLLQGCLIIKITRESRRRLWKNDRHSSCLKVLS